MKSIELKYEQKHWLASKAIQHRFISEEQSPVKSGCMLSWIRNEDVGNSLWKVFNIIQENTIKGGLKGFNPTTGKRVTTRAIRSITDQVRLNKLLWNDAISLL